MRIEEALTITLTAICVEVGAISDYSSDWIEGRSAAPHVVRLDWGPLGRAHVVRLDWGPLGAPMSSDWIGGRPAAAPHVYESARGCLPLVPPQAE